MDYILSILGNAFSFIEGRGYTGDDNSAAGGSLHSGVDFRAPLGTPVPALTAGTVVYASDESNPNAGRYHAIGGGNVVNIQDSAGQWQYAHLNSFIVKPGDVVTKGQIIGYVGQSGPYASGPHLHLGRQEAGKWIDPLQATIGVGGPVNQRPSNNPDPWNDTIGCFSQKHPGISRSVPAEYLPDLIACADQFGLDLSKIDLSNFAGKSLSDIRDYLASLDQIPGADPGAGIIPDFLGDLQGALLFIGIILVGIVFILTGGLVALRNRSES